MLALAAAGLIVAGYLTMVQLGALASAWDPVFGQRSTREVLELTRPVPDALAGVLAYGTEVVLLLARRGRLLLGLVLTAGGLPSIALIIIQPAVVGAWCALSAPPRSPSCSWRSATTKPQAPSRRSASPSTGCAPCSPTSRTDRSRRWRQVGGPVAGRL